MALRKIIPMLFASLALIQSSAFADVINKREAIKIAKSKYQVKVQLAGAIESIDAAGKQYFKIKLLLVDKGRIKTVYVNSANGKVLKRKPQPRP